jgi:hypothetical protein
MKSASTSPDPYEFPALVGDLYARWTLDCLVEIAYAIAQDFVGRPQLYLGDDVPESIVELRIASGTDPRFPNGTQRQTMLLPILGRSDGASADASSLATPFHSARRKFLDACIAFSERAVDSGVAMLVERVRSAVVPLRAHLEGLDGRSLRLSTLQIRSASDTAIAILKSPNVAKIFGVSPADDPWPLQSIDPNGAKLVENVGTKLPLPQDCKLAYTKFVLLQRVAQEGARTLALLLGSSASEEALTALITQGYTWGASLRDFQQA